MRPRIHKGKNPKKATINITFTMAGYKRAWSDLLEISDKVNMPLTMLAREILARFTLWHKESPRDSIAWITSEQLDVFGDEKENSGENEAEKQNAGADLEK